MDKKRTIKFIELPDEVIDIIMQFSGCICNNKNILLTSKSMLLQRNRIPLCKKVNYEGLSCCIYFNKNNDYLNDKYETINTLTEAYDKFKKDGRLRSLFFKTNRQLTFGFPYLKDFGNISHQTICAGNYKVFYKQISSGLVSYGFSDDQEEMIQNWARY